MSDDRESTVVVDDAAEKDPPADGDKDLKRLKKALSALQKEKTTLESQLADFRKEIENAKLSEQQRTSKELEEFKATLAKRDAEKATLEAEVARERRVSVLVAKHGLADPDFADVILKRWNPEEHEDFDTFAASAKKDKKYAPLFTGIRPTEITNDDGSKVIPAAPGTPSRATGRAGPSGPSEDDMEIAKTLYPNAPARQTAYLENLKKIKQVR